MDVVQQIINWMPALIQASGTTLLLTVTSVCAALVLSVFLALGKIIRPQSDNRFTNALCAGIRAFSSSYIFVFRGTPLLMQLFFIYYALPRIAESLTIQSRFFAAFLAFMLNISAYLAEIIRAAIQSIDKGQFEASRALGFSYGQTMRMIIIPQSYRRMIPPIANEFIMVLKDTSLVSIISLVELTYQTRMISSNRASTLVYIPAMAIYLVMTAIFTVIFNRLEKRFSIHL